ncbi:MAG: riboflavin synthase [Bdellovibrionota bacterium]
MFTGIVEHSAKILEKDADKLTVEHPGWTDLQQGQSIAVNGCCLTIIDHTPQAMSFELSPETLGKTNLGTLSLGKSANLERAMKLGHRLDGHLVSGHVDDQGTILSIQPQNNYHHIEIEFDSHFCPWLISKGSITVDGVSLTLNEIKKNMSCFSVMIIPHTFANTRFGSYQEGDRVNLEFDLVAKYIQNMMQLEGNIDATPRS